MRSNDPMENLLRESRYQAAPERREQTLQNVFHALDEVHEPSAIPARLGLWGTALHGRTGRLVLAAAVILIVFGGIGLWPSGNGNRSQWWLGAPAAWGQEILHSLDQIEAVVYRQRLGHVSDYGPPSMSQYHEIRFNAKGRYRRDRYDNGVDLMNTQWVLADGNDLRMTEVSYEYRCYFERENEAYGYIEDIMDRMQSYVRLLDKADRILKTQVFDGRECVGFEISAARYGSNPPGPFTRIWFDVQTRLPARIECHYENFASGAGQTDIIIHDQFQYYAKVPVDLFTPQVPAGYVKAHPDDIRLARDRQVKGEMVDAEVPKGLKEKVITALTRVHRGSYRKNGTRVSFSRNAWREDQGDNPVRQTVWCVRRGTLPEGPFEPNDNFALTETLVNYEQRTFRIRDHLGGSQPRHPMLDILRVADRIERADRFYESAEKDGVKCFGFDVSAKKYGDNPDGMVDRMWIDAATNLPVRIEFEWPRGDRSGTFKETKDQFQWDLPFPDDYFVPKIPAGFTPAEGKE
jgi:outer membrane lipoprotein-sorting protein